MQQIFALSVLFTGFFIFNYSCDLFILLGTYGYRWKRAFILFLGNSYRSVLQALVTQCFDSISSPKIDLLDHSAFEIFLQLPQDNSRHDFSFLHLAVSRFRLEEKVIVSKISESVTKRTPESEWIVSITVARVPISAIPSEQTMMMMAMAQETKIRCSLRSHRHQ